MVPMCSNRQRADPSAAVEQLSAHVLVMTQVQSNIRSRARCSLKHNALMSSLLQHVYAGEFLEALASDNGLGMQREIAFLPTPCDTLLSLFLLAQGRVRESRAGEPFGPGGARGGPSVDLAGTRTVKEILRAVNAKRLSVEIARRFSATVDSASSTNTDATASVGTDGSTAPAAAAAAVGEVGRKTNENMGTAESTEGGAHGGNSLGRGNYSTQPELHPGNPPEKTERGGRGGKLGAANELLARVRGQLERSEQRTNGAPGERGVGHDIAPQR